MVTYNHEKYIADALNSIIEQQTQFNFEVIIGEDCSIDKTKQIIEGFCKKYPGRFSPIYHPKNMGVKFNIESVLRACKGKYIAILEGDDYWSSPEKLQEQVDFLENNTDYTSCFHNVKIIHDINSDKKYDFCKFKSNQSFSFSDLLYSNFIPTCSIVFRNSITEEFLLKLRNIMAGDWYLHLYNSELGNTYYINKFMAVYRAHANGQWAGLSQTEAAKFKINALFDIDRAFEFKYTNKIRENVFKIYENKPLGYKDLIKYYYKRFKK